MDLGPHAAFIWTAYAIVAVTISALIFWLIWDGKRLRALADDLDARGTSRRAKTKS